MSRKRLGNMYHQTALIRMSKVSLRGQGGGCARRPRLPRYRSASLRASLAALAAVLAQAPSALLAASRHAKASAPTSRL